MMKVPFFAIFCLVGLIKCDNLVELAIKLNLTTFVNEIKKVGIDRIINHEGKFTVFAPNNEAFEREVNYPNEASLKDKLRFHVAWGEVKAADIKNEKVMRTLLPKRTVRLNVYRDGKVVTANGRMVKSTDHHAHNGVIHIVSDVMSSVYNKEGSVVSEIDECCPHHSVLMELIKKSGLYPVLDKRGPFTFLPPNNGAFAKLHPDYIHHLVKNETALRLVLLTHVISGTFYSTGLSDGAVVKTLSGTSLNVSVKNGVVKIGKGTVEMVDVTASNGAVHSIDEVLFPFHPPPEYSMTNKIQVGVLDLVARLQKIGHTDFAQAIIDSEIAVEIALRGPVTVFSPSNKGMRHKKVTKLKKKDLANYVRTHIVPQVFKSFENEQVVDTLAAGHSLRLNKYRFENEALEMVNGKEVAMHGYNFNNGVIHVIKGEDFTASNETLYEQLAKLDLKKTLIKFMEEGMDDILHQLHYPFTIFAPSDEYIDLTLIPPYSKSFGLAHIIPKTMFKRALENEEYIFTLSGEKLKVTKENEKMFLNGMELRQVDQLPINGMIYQLDGLLV